MITPEEREEIVSIVTERILLSLPKIIATLMANHATAVKIHEKFYTSHPELKGHEDLVAKVVEHIEGANTLEDYGKILESSVTEVKRQLPLVKSLDTKKVLAGKPNLGRF